MLECWAVIWFHCCLGWDNVCKCPWYTLLTESQTEPDRQTCKVICLVALIKSIIYRRASPTVVTVKCLLSLLCMKIANIINFNVRFKFEYLFLSIFSFQLQTRRVTKMHDHFHDLPVSSLFNWLISRSVIAVNTFNKSFNILICLPCYYSSHTVLNRGTIVLPWKSRRSSVVLNRADASLKERVALWLSCCFRHERW